MTRPAVATGASPPSLCDRRDPLGVVRHGIDDAAQRLGARGETTQRVRQRPDGGLGRHLLGPQQALGRADRREHLLARGSTGQLVSGEQRGEEHVLELVAQQLGRGAGRANGCTRAGQPGGAAAGRAHHEHHRLRRELRARHRLAAHLREHQPPRECPDLVEPLVDARQRRNAERTGFDVVERHDREVVGEHHPGLGQDSRIRPSAVRSVATITAVGRCVAASRSRAALLASGLRAVGRREHDRRVDDQVVRRQRGQVRVVALTDVRLGQVPDETDARVPAVHDEVLDRGERPAVVVRHGCRGVEVRHPRVRQDDLVPRVTQLAQVRPADGAHDRYDAVHVGPRDPGRELPRLAPWCGLRRRLDDDQATPRACDLTREAGEQLAELVPTQARGQGQHRHRSVHRLPFPCTPGPPVLAGPPSHYRPIGAGT